MDLLEIAVGKLIASFVGLVLFLINPQIPFLILLEPMLLDELVLLLGRRLMLTPRIAVVEYNTSSVNQSLGMLICLLVQYHCHDGSSSAFVEPDRPIPQLRAHRARPHCGLPLPSSWWRRDGRLRSTRRHVSSADSWDIAVEGWDLVALTRTLWLSLVHGELFYGPLALLITWRCALLIALRGGRTEAA
jgi:hypothetical protein